MSFSLDVAWLQAVLLAGVRIVAFIVIAPPFSYNAIPMRVKAMLAVGLSLAVAPTVTHDFVSVDTGAFIVDLLLQVVIGGALGFLVMLVFAAVQSAGSLVDMFGGFQMAQGFDPQAMVNGAQFTRLFQMTAIALLFASDGYQLIIGGLTRSFTAVPLGGEFDMSAPAAAMLGAVTQMFLAAVQIGGPLLVVLFLADAGLGLLTRVAPALNAFAMGFPLKILLTLVLAGVVFVAMPRVVASLSDTAVGTILGVN